MSVSDSLWYTYEPEVTTFYDFSKFSFDFTYDNNALNLEDPDKSWLKEKIILLGLSDFVELIPFTPNVYTYLNNAKFLALTSRYEGFPRVLLESLSTGTPVISVNCKSGPNEIIAHEVNGLLVENFNIKKLSEAFNRFVLEEDLYLHCKQNAKKSIDHLSADTIAKQWTKYLKNELQ